MKLSIGMMVKNEAKNLDRCLQALQPLRDGLDSELVIVDTGSEDNTVEIAKKYTDKVYFHKWNNDFSAMRNITISYAKGEWFLVIDADEVLENPQAIVTFLKSKESKKFNVGVLFVLNYTNENDFTKYSTLLSTRLFRKTPKFHYTGAVHNQPVYEEGPVFGLKAKIHHYGYLSTNKELMERKFIRTSTILKSELEKDPEHIYYLYQLSVTYGMHEDFNEAIEYIEKAYQVFLKLGRPKSCMFVLTHRAMMYQLTRNFKKVEEVCLGAIEVSDGYIDIYYYLAEAQAVLEKHQEAIRNYHKYLELLAGYYDVTEKDGGIIDYTLGNGQLTYFNLSNLYKKTNDFEKALQYAEKITDKQLVKDNLYTIVYLYIKLDKYEALKHYYDQIVENKDRYVFYQYVEEIKRKFDEKLQLAVAAAFYMDESEYGLLSKILLENQNGGFSTETLEKIKHVDLSKLPLGCSAILYYLLQYRYPLHTMLEHFKETWMDCLFEYIAKYYADLDQKLYEYVQNYQEADSTSAYKLNKTLCRYFLLLHKSNDAAYQTVLDCYIKYGISYMQSIYNPRVLADKLVYEVKNDEEVFLIYMHHARCNKGVNQAEYVKYLREALQAFPQVKNGVEYLLKEFAEKQAAEAEAEMLEYRQQVKTTIKQLIENGELAQAGALIAEYEEIVAGDIDICSMKAVIAIMEQRFAEAENILVDALFIDNQNFDIWYNLAYLYEAQEQNEKARAIYKNLQEKNYDQEQNLVIQTSLNRLASAISANSNQAKTLKEINILLGTMEIANQMYTLTDTLQKRKYNIHSINYHPTYLGYQGDLAFSYDDCKTQQDVDKKIKDFAKHALNEYDLFHFYFGTSLTFNHSDLPLLKTLNKKMVMSYFGSDIRRYSIAKQYNPYVKVKNHNEEQIINDLDNIAQYIEHCIVDWELYLYVKDFFKNIHIIPGGTIDLSKYKPIEKRKGNIRPLIVHAPTNPEIKGTEYIIKAVEELKDKYKFDFQLVQGMKHEDAKKIYQKADIIIDQLLLGTYGIFALEGMAMGKTVICWISDYMKEKHPKELPIVSANPDTIKKVLEDLLSNIDMLPSINKQGRLYVEKYHSTEKMADHLIEIYQKVIS